MAGGVAHRQHESLTLKDAWCVCHRQADSFIPTSIVFPVFDEQRHSVEWASARGPFDGGFTGGLVSKVPEQLPDALLG